MFDTAKEQSCLLSYLTDLFPGTLAAVVREFPRGRRYAGFGHCAESDNGIVLQPCLLTTRNPAIQRMTEGERTLFSATLCWTVLLDECVYCWYRDHYEAFRKVTYFPKLVGDCKGGCSSHLDPAAALALVGGDAGDWLCNRIQRRAMFERLAPMVQHLVGGLASRNRMPWLHEMFTRAVKEIDYDIASIPTLVHSFADLVGETRWQMPRISRDQYARRLDASRYQHRESRLEYQRRLRARRPEPESDNLFES